MQHLVESNSLIHASNVSVASEQLVLERHKMMVAGCITLVQQSSAQLISSYTKDATLKRPISIEEMILHRKTLGEVAALSQPLF